MISELFKYFLLGIDLLGSLNHSSSNIQESVCSRICLNYSQSLDVLLTVTQQEVLFNIVLPFQQRFGKTDCQSKWLNVATAGVCIFNKLLHPGNGNKKLLNLNDVSQALAISFLPVDILVYANCRCGGFATTSLLRNKCFYLMSFPRAFLRFLAWQNNKAMAKKNRQSNCEKCFLFSETYCA